MNILVVDDDKQMRTFVKAAVAQMGHNCETAASGSEALERLAATTFDVVLLDILMPDVDGLEVLRRLADQPPVSLPRIVET